MLLSVSHRFLFIHVNKVAGTSVQHALQRFAEQPLRDGRSRLKHRLNLTRDFSKRPYAEHIHASRLQAQLPPAVFDEYFKFAFVRNPWDWLVSSYNYLCSNSIHRHHAQVAAMNSFEEYADFEIKRGKRSQSVFVCDADQVIVEYLGRFETLDDDFATVCRHLNIDAGLPHVNESKHRDYREHYTDKVAEKVAEHWQSDIRLFAYEFDGLKTDAKRNFARVG